MRRAGEIFSGKGLTQDFEKYIFQSITSEGDHMPEDQKAITIRLTLAEHKKIKLLAAETGKTIKELFLEGIAKIKAEEEAKA